MQHWWLPPSGQGVRTRSLRRPRLAAVRRRSLRRGHRRPRSSRRDGAFSRRPGARTTARLNRTFSRRSPKSSRSLFEHCARALDHSLAVGSHGLPLIGSGDWNDGMNRVGAGGKGESIWLGWFLHATLSAFAPLADASRRAGARHDLAASCDGACGNRSSGTDGTAAGIGAATSTTERRSVRPPASNAASIRSRSRGA